jgi:hypothetical protein
MFRNTSTTTPLLLALLLSAAAPSQGWMVHAPALITRPMRSMARDLDTFTDFSRMFDDMSEDLMGLADVFDAPEALLLRGPGGRRQNKELALSRRRVGEILPSSPTFDFTQTKDGEYLLTVSRSASRPQIDVPATCLLLVDRC